MRVEKQDIAVSLTGGMGNQLFQIAACLYYSDGNGINVVTELGRPRTTLLGVPSALQFNFNNQVHVLPSKADSLFWIKSAGFILRRGILIKKHEKILGVGNVVELVLKFLLKLKFKRHIIRAVGVGDTVLDIKKSRNLLLGYFQTDNWLTDPYVLQTLQSMEITGGKEIIEFYSVKAAEENPLIVHLRIGDYKNEPDIGLLPPEYYHRALSEFAKLEEFRNIWLFSDEPEIALDKMPQSLQSRTEIITIPENNDALTLQVMRLGKNYILSNSTFGWWAARLSCSADPTVLVPDRWFKALPEPEGLIPEKWVRIHAWEA